MEGIIFHDGASWDLPSRITKVTENLDGNVRSPVALRTEFLQNSSWKHFRYAFPSTNIYNSFCTL
jgi:hypothetical protein